MPWYTRPTLTEADDGALLIHQVGPTRSEVIESVNFLVPAVLMLVATWGWPPHWATASEQPAPIALGLLCLVVLAGLLILRRRQWRPRTDRIDDQGIERRALVGTARHLLWSDVRDVSWHLDWIGLSGPGDKDFTISRRDFASDDWSVVFGRTTATLRRRFDLPPHPRPTASFRWGRIMLTSLPSAVLLGGCVLLMPHLGRQALGIVVLACVGGMVQHLWVVGCWCRRLSRPQLGNPYRAVRGVPPDVDAPLTQSVRRSPSGIPSIETDRDGVLVISKEKASVDDKGRVIGALGFVVLMVLFAALFVFEPQIDHRVAQPSTKAVVFFGTLALWAIAWAAGACRRAYQEFDRGTWRIETDRVEFASFDGTTQSLRAGEVERVLWESWSIRLRGRGTEIRLVPHGIGSVAWQPVRDRVGAMLAPRFDLGPLPTPPDAGRRFLWAAAPIVLVPLVAVPIAMAVPTEQLDLALLGWWVSTVLANAYLIRVVRRERDEWLWRRPRGGAGQEGIVASAR